MFQTIRHTSLLIILILITTGCSKFFTTETKTNTTPKSCYIMYDAGSSGTRLYIYEKQGTSWIKHEGPKVSALADPIRGNRGKNSKDIESTVNEVISSLDNIKQDGPMKKDKPKWEAFDWSSKCKVVSARVYATGGMRIAEQQNPKESSQLWKKLKEKLKKKVGDSVEVSTRTITGYEEGLYAWLTVRNKIKDNDFGIVEMGGASSQITFPCPKCDPTNSAVKTITLADNPIQIYSYSFLGLGQNQAHKSLGLPSSCAYGIGTTEQKWEEKQCANQISIQKKQGIYAPYNYNNQKLGIYNSLPSQQKNLSKWYLTGNFKYMNKNDVNNCCSQKGKCYQKETSCFRAVYLKKYLQILSIPSSSEKMKVSWTKGAVICESEGCLKKDNQLTCRWLNENCLE